VADGVIDIAGSSCLESALSGCAIADCDPGCV
jgi:hypothetical protein